MNYLPTIGTIQEIFSFRLSPAFFIRLYSRFLLLSTLFLSIMAMGTQLGVQLVRELCNPQGKMR